MRNLALLAIFLFSAGSAALAQQKRIYIACDDHTDYMWSGDEAAYQSAFLTMLDYYLDLADSTDANPPDYQSRFACDGSFWLWVYERNRTAGEFERLIERIRDGHISSPLTTLVSCYGGTPLEAALRGMYYAGRLERRYDLRFPLAVALENQTLPLGLASLWAGSGARYSWRGICGCVSRTPSPGDREHDIYWYTGPDGQRVLMKWNSMLGDNQGMGGYAECWNPVATVDFVSNSAAFQARYPYYVIGCFGRGWDNLQTLTDEFPTVAQTMTNAQRRVIVSNEEDFFVDFEAAFGGSIPSESRTYGNEWDLYCASMAEVSASVKRSVELLRSAEALATVVSLNDPDFMSGREAARDLAFTNLGLYWEHDWTADGPVSRTARALWQRRIAAEISAYVNALRADAAAALGRQVTPGGGNPRFFVFNPLGWARTDVARLPYTGPEAHVIDVTTGVEVPSQVEVHDSGDRIAIIAANVPPVGYRVYEVVPGAGQGFSDAATISDGPVEPTGVTFQVQADNRDAMSTFSGGAVHVRVSGHSAGNRVDYVGSDADQETAAMQFALNLPANATIESAYLSVRVGGSANPSPTGGLAIRAYDVDSAAPFVNGAAIDLVSHQPVTAQSILWPAPDWSGGDMVSPDITPLVQAFIDRPGYAPGNYLGIVVTEGTIAANHYYGWNDFAAGNTPPRLVVRYTTGDEVPTSKVIDNGVYGVTVAARGAITSLIDHTRGEREFIREIVRSAANDLGDFPGGAVAIEHNGPVFATLRADAPLPLSHTSRITLYRGLDRVDIANTIIGNFGDVRTYAYSFNLDSPDVRYEEVGAIARAKLTGSGGDYAPRNARYDWLTLNHFADMTGTHPAGGTFGITLSNADCYFMRLGNSTLGSLDVTTPQINPLIGGQVDGPGLGIPNQGGDSWFDQRFALRTHGAYDPAAAMRMSLEHQNPLVAGAVVGTEAALPADRYAAMNVDNVNVLLWALKPAEEQNRGVIARFWNVSDAPQSAIVDFSGAPIQAAKRVTHIETDLENALFDDEGLHASFARQQILTYRLLPGLRGDVNCDGVVNNFDIDPFVLALTDPAGYAAAYPECNVHSADVNADGVVNNFDIDPFVACLTGECP